MVRQHRRPRKGHGHGINMGLGTKPNSRENNSVKPEVAVKLWNQTHGLANELNVKNNHFYHTGEDEIGNRHFRTTPISKADIKEELDSSVLSELNAGWNRDWSQGEEFKSINQFIDYWKYNYNHANDRYSNFKLYMTDLLRKDYFKDYEEPEKELFTQYILQQIN